MPFQPSIDQIRIFCAMVEGTGNIQIIAGPGSGKSVTLIEGVKFLPQDIIESTVFLAFSKEIEKALKEKQEAGQIPREATIRTIYAMGFGAFIRHMSQRLGRRWSGAVKEERYRKLIESYWRFAVWPGSDEKDAEIIQQAQDAMLELVKFARLTLHEDMSAEGIARLAAEREVLLPMVDTMTRALPVILGWGVNGLPHPDEKGNRWALSECIDFTDMVWLPWKLNLTPDQYKMVLVDEQQDLSAAQINLVLKCRAPGGRIVAVGDPRQAIFAFAGADAKAFDYFQEVTGAMRLPLMTCYRCPLTAIRRAQKISDTIQAAPGAIEGVEDTLHVDTVPEVAKPGDMILCRVNAPLITMAFQLIAQGKPATVRGRNIGTQLVKVFDAIGKIEGFTFDRFIEASEKYRDMQLSFLRQKENNEGALIAVNERVDSVQAVYAGAVDHGARTLGDLRRWVQDLFADEQRGQIILSSIHRAKGLEADRVFFLHPEKIPHPMARSAAAREQETNLLWVLHTRNKKEFYFIDHTPRSKGEKKNEEKKEE